MSKSISEFVASTRAQTTETSWLWIIILAALAVGLIVGWEFISRVGEAGAI